MIEDRPCLHTAETSPYCTICGKPYWGVLSPEEEEDRRCCEQHVDPAIPDIAVGDTVQLYSSVVQRLRPILKKIPEQYCMTKWFYSPPRFQLGFGKELPTHTVCIVVKTTDLSDGSTRPWVQGDTNYRTRWLSHAQFVLWQEGNEARLIQAGLVFPRKKVSLAVRILTLGIKR